MTWFGKKLSRLTLDAWRSLVAGVPLFDGMDSGELARLHDVCGDFVRTKTFEGCGGLAIDDAMRWQIAAQACLLVLELGVEAYSRFSSVLVYPRVRMIDAEGRHLLQLLQQLLDRGVIRGGLRWIQRCGQLANCLQSVAPQGF